MNDPMSSTVQQGSVPLPDEEDVAGNLSYETRVKAAKYDELMAARAAKLDGGVTDEAQREGYDDVESYVAALKQSRDTYFAERNSARDAYRRHRDESDSRGRLINVVLGLVDAPPGANVVQAVAAALTTAARAAEPGTLTLSSPITEDMHVAACKVLRRASGFDGLPQRMLDAMVAASGKEAP